MKSGTIFDNLLITDDAQLAKDECDKILKETVAGEKKMKDAKEEEDRKAAEAAAADEDEEEEEEEEEDVEGEDEIVRSKYITLVSWIK